MFILEFFRDTLSGFVYVIYLIVCIFALFYLMGLVADRKRKAINKKLKDKKTYDIESGREAAIAALETKQILDVDDNNLNKRYEETINASMGQYATKPDIHDPNAQKEEVPSVMVLSSDSSSAPTENKEAPKVEEPKQEEQQDNGPLVIDTGSIKIDSSSIKIDSSSIKQ